ncbi:hypothetical protein HU230_0015585 [Bradyrhizobium quebecense]|nr:hypothetical protein [Bradyrhizobium quebecense]UGA47375.1 hypothetical protein HU230_0015585 [Bradyrhizobium quebecense]
MPGTVAKFFRSLREPDFERIGLLHAAADLSHAFSLYRFLPGTRAQLSGHRKVPSSKLLQQPIPLLQCVREERCRASAPTGNPVHLTPVRDPAVVLTPGGPRRGSGEIRTGDVAVSSGPGPSQAGKVFFSHVNARAIEAVCLLMVDSLDLETLMSVIP